MPYQSSGTYTSRPACTASNNCTVLDAPPVLCTNQLDLLTVWATPWQVPDFACNQTVLFNWTSYPNLSVRSSPVELEMIATIVSAVVYGMVFSLYIICFQALAEGKRKYSTRKRYFLYIYITLMLLLSTASLIGDILISMNDIFFTLYTNPEFHQIILNDTDIVVFAPLLVFPFTIWAADVFMMWRCMALYQGISRIWRAVVLVALVILFLLSSALCLMTFISFLGAQFIVVPGSKFGPQWSFVVTSVSGAINLVLSVLIALRIRYHQSYIRKALGSAHGSLYTHIMIMCVESCSLITVFELLYIILTFRPEALGFYSQYPFFLLPHICVISPLLIIYRVARGMETTATGNATDVVNGEISGIERRIHFVSPISSTQDREGM